MDNTFSSNRYRVWFAWLILSLFLAYQYALRVLPNVIMPYLNNKFSISAADFGQFSGLYYVGYTAMHIPIGIMLDFISPRLIISISVLLVVAGMFPLLYSESWAMVSFGRFVVGAASSAAILGTFKVIRMGFSSERFAFILGISVAIGFIGASYGGPLVSYLSDVVGMDSALMYLIYAGLVLSIISFFALPSERANFKSGILQELKELFSHKKWIYIAALGGLMVGPIEGFADGWAKTFLEIAYPSLQKYQFTLLPSLILFGLACGAPILGYIAQKTQSYYRLIIISGFFMFTGFIIMFIRFDSTLILFPVFFMIGMFSSYQTLVIHKSCALAPEKFVGLTTACANMVIMVFGYFFHSSIGEIIKNSTGDKNQYSFEALLNGISIIPILLFIASSIFVYISIKDNEK